MGGGQVSGGRKGAGGVREGRKEAAGERKRIGGLEGVEVY